MMLTDLCADRTLGDGGEMYAGVEGSRDGAYGCKEGHKAKGGAKSFDTHL